MSDLIQRDPYEMVKFADEMDNYCDSMRLICNELKISIEAAKPGMRDDFSEKARSNIDAFIDEVVDSLKEVKGKAETLRKAAKPLFDAVNL